MVSPPLKCTCIPYFLHDLQCIGNPPTLTYIYSGISHHTIPSKYSVAGTLYHRAKTICSNQEMLLKEEQHLFQALKKCKYPTWALNRVKMRCQNPSNKRRNNNKSQHNNNTMRNLYMVVPYYQGLSESIKRSCKKYGVQVHFKGGLTIKNLLMAPKDKDHILKKVESYTDIVVIGWSAMRNTLGNPQELLLKGSRNIKRLPPLYMIILTNGNSISHSGNNICHRIQQHTIMATTSANKHGNNICHRMIHHSHKWQQQQPQWQ